MHCANLDQVNIESLVLTRVILLQYTPASIEPSIAFGSEKTLLPSCFEKSNIRRGWSLVTEGRFTDDSRLLGSLKRRAT